MSSVNDSRLWLTKPENSKKTAGLRLCLVGKRFSGQFITGSPASLPSGAVRLSSPTGLRYRRWIAQNPCRHFPTRPLLYQHLFDTQDLAGPIEYLEFGVWKGESISWWVAKNLHPESSFTGFDSFEGLPTDWEWERARKGAYSANGKVPEIADPRCRFIKGWFHESLPPWLNERKGFDRRLVVNLDADLYGSTLFVLIQLMPRLKLGDILIFDEFHSYNHEFRAS